MIVAYAIMIIMTVKSIIVKIYDDQIYNDKIS